MRVPTLFASILIGSLLFAQEASVRFNHLTTDDGLSNDRVNCFVQDERGYMWIGTNDGLNRYDGHRFRTFRRSSTENSICGNNISILKIDSQGTIWIGTHDGGLCSLDPETMTFDAYPVADQLPTVTNKVMSLALKDDSTLFVGFEKTELLILNITSGRYEMHPTAVGHPHPATIYSMHFDPLTDRLYHSAIHIGLRWVRECAVGELVERLGIPEYPAYTMNVIHRDGKGVLWGGAWDDALHRIDPEDGRHDYYVIGGGEIRFNANEIQALAEDGKGRLWVGTRFGGLFLFDREHLTFQRIRSEISDRGSARGQDIEALYRDAQDRIWVGSEEGVSTYDPMLNQFEVHWLPGLDEAGVNAFYQDGDSLLIGHTKGLSYLSDDTFDHHGLVHEGKPLSVGVFYKDDRHSLFVGTNKSVFSLDPSRAQLHTMLDFSLPEYDIYHDIPSSHVSDILQYETKEDSLLLAFYYGYDLLVIDKNTYHASPNHIGMAESYENLVRRMKVDSRGRLWILCTSKGLIQVTDPFVEDSIRRADRPLSEGGSRYYLESEAYLGKGATGSRLTCPDLSDMHEASDGTFWLTTRGGGLFRFDPENEVEMFEDMNSPISDLGSALLTPSGELWVCTSNGVLRYSPQTDEYRLYGNRDGIPSSGLRGRPFQDGRGFLYLGGRGFFIRFHPDRIRINDVVAENHLDEILIHNRKVDKSSLSTALPYDRNFISYQFSSPNLSDPSRNRFQYKLEGLDNDWNMTSKEIKADYTSIPPGEYELLCRSANNDGKWNEASVLHSFSITPPWWRTWWFYLLVTLSIALLLYALYQYRISQIKRLYEVRDTIARDLHDDIGSTLGSISIYSQVAKNNLRASDGAEEVIDMIGQTSRTMMDRVGDIVWAVNPKNDELDQLVSRMKNYAAPLLQASGIRFDFQFDERASDVKLKMIQRKNLFLIFKEVVHNALKYSECNELKVGLHEQSGRITLSIEDDGNGFDPAAVDAYNGNGLLNMRSRSKDMGGKLTMSSSPGQGCRVRVSVEQ